MWLRAKKHFPILSEHYSTALMWLFTTETTAKTCNKSIEKLVIKALNLEQVFQIPTEKDIIFSHKNYATTIYKTWSNSVTDIKIPVGYWLLLLSFLLLWTDCMCLTFDIGLYVFYFCPQMVWCLLLLMTDYQLRIATISSYVKCTAAHGSMIDQHSQTFPYDWLTLQLWGSLLDNSSSKYWWKMRLTTGVVCCSYLFWCVQSNNTCIRVSVGHFEKLRHWQEKKCIFRSICTN